MEIHFNITSVKGCHFQLPFTLYQTNLEADGDTGSPL